MPLYWDNKALPTPTQYVIFLIIFLFLNKCLSDAIWDSKRKKKEKFAKRQIRSRVDRVKMSTTRTLNLYH